MCKRNQKSARNSMTNLKPQNQWTMDEKRRINDFHGIVESVANVWRFLGIFPLTLENSTGIKKYKLNKFCCFYSIAFFLICIANFHISMLTHFSKYYRRNLPMVAVTVITRSLLGILYMVLANLWRIVKFRELMESLNALSEQGLILERIGCRLDYESGAKIVSRFVWITFGTISTLIANDFVLAVREYHVFWIQAILWLIPILVQVMDLTILASLVACIGLKFRAINEKIKKVVKMANSPNPKIITRSNMYAENLRLLSKAHYNTCAIGKRINSIFNCCVIINVTTGFIVLSTTLYYIIYEVQRVGETRYTLILKYLRWEFIHSSPITVIVITCNWVSYQEMCTGKLIHEIRIRKSDSKLYEAIKSFSLQLHHQKLQFTAAGLFPLNSSLLQTMLGNITTYLVILIQFQPNLANLFN